MIETIIFIILLYTMSILAAEQCNKVVDLMLSVNDSKVSKGIVIWFPANVGAQYQYDKCASDTGLPLQRKCTNSAGNSKWLVLNKNEKYIDCKQIVSYCKDEAFEHYYRNEDNELEKVHNKWLSVKMGEIGRTEEPCFINTEPLTRKCAYNPQAYQVEWEVLDNKNKSLICFKEKLDEIQVQTLQTLRKKVKENFELHEIQPKNALSEAIHLTETSKVARSPEDIKAIGDILNVTLTNNEDPHQIQNVLKITNILMNAEADIVKESNCSNKILTAINTYFDRIAKPLLPTDRCDISNNGIYRESVPMATLFFINPICSNISGVACFGSANSPMGFQRHHDQHTGNYYRFLYLNQSLQELLRETDLKVATYFPYKLWNSMLNDNDTTILKLILYKSDVLFVNQILMYHQPIKPVLEIAAVGYRGNLSNALPVIFKISRGMKREKVGCGYFNQETWVGNGVETSNVKGALNQPLLLCNTSHLTPFSFLLGIESKPNLLESLFLDFLDTSALDLISISGCGLSLFGLICIWLTALCFPRWREQSSNKVLLNLCFVLTLVMVFFLMYNFPQFRDSIVDMQNSTHCLLMGGFLQYIILVLFCWMLFIAITQYQRYIKVLGYERPTNYIRKYFLISWGLPLIPTMLVAYYEPNSYMPNEESINNDTAICYPTGNGLLYGVMLPIAITIFANLCIFVYICYSFYRMNINFKNQRNRKTMLRQIQLSILLFFLLGISWLFGILARLGISTLFSYIFCLTSTLQGFVLFIYFILINKTTRSTWRNFCCCGVNIRENY